jgi:DMSO/TMAO reductase YedYZ molybdopterin-dependent catalytic subunit
VSYIIEEIPFGDSHMNKKILQTLLLITAVSFLFSAFIASSSSLETYATDVATANNTEWTVQVDGEVANPVNLTISDLLAMPSASVYAELYCYGKLVTSGVWTGVPVASVLEEAEVNQQAKSATFYATDGYTITFSVSDITEKGLIAYELDGQALPETLRLVIPQANGDRWIAMIIHIHLSMDEAPPLPPANANILSGLSASPEATPTLQPSPTPQPSATPSPTATPDSSQTPESPTTPVTTQSNQNPVPLTWTVTAVATVAIVSAGIARYFKKRR